MLRSEQVGLPVLLASWKAMLSFFRTDIRAFLQEQEETMNICEWTHSWTGGPFSIPRAPGDIAITSASCCLQNAVEIIRPCMWYDSMSSNVQFIPEICPCLTETKSTVCNCVRVSWTVCQSVLLPFFRLGSLTVPQLGDVSPQVSGSVWCIHSITRVPGASLFPFNHTSWVSPNTFDPPLNSAIQIYMEILHSSCTWAVPDQRQEIFPLLIGLGFFLALIVSCTKIVCLFVCVCCFYDIYPK